MESAHHAWILHLFLAEQNVSICFFYPNETPSFARIKRIKIRSLNSMDFTPHSNQVKKWNDCYLRLKNSSKNTETPSSILLAVT